MIPELKYLQNMTSKCMYIFTRAIVSRCMLIIIFSIDWAEIRNFLTILQNTNIGCSVICEFFIHAPLIYTKIKSGLLKGFENIVCLLNEQKLD